MKRNKKFISEPQRGSTFVKEDIRQITNLLKKDTPLTRGNEVTNFEKEFSDLTGAKYAIAVSSCSAALRIAFQMLNLSSKDEVIIPANAFWNSVNPILETSAKIKIVDVSGYDLTISPDILKKKITKKTKAILLLDYAGNPCEYEKIIKIVKNKNITLIEDAAHATGSYYKKKHVGSLVDISCFSFSTLKNINTLGEGGMICTNSRFFAELANKMRNCYPIGNSKKSSVRFNKYKIPKNNKFMRPGDSLTSTWQKVYTYSGRYTMSSVQALAGSCQLKRLPNFLKQRKRIARVYSKWVESKKGFKVLEIKDDTVCSWHLYIFFITKESGVNRNEFVKILEEDLNLEIINRYWPINLNAVMMSKGHKLGEAKTYEEIWFKEMVSLPISQIMHTSDAEEIVSRLNEAYCKLK